MANQLDANVKDDLKTQFVTREGTYRLLTLSEYSRPNRVGYSSNQSSPQVRVSMVTLPNPSKLGGEAGAGSPTAGAGVSGTAATTTTNGGGSTSPAASPTGGGGGAAPVNSGGGAGSSAGGGGTSAITNGGAGGDNSYSHTNNTNAGSSTVDARLGGGISMHSMMNGGVLDQNGVATSQVIGGDRICFNFGRDLYVYSFRGAKKVR